MRIPLLYRGEYSQWVKRFMNYLEEQTDRESMINSIKNGDQPLPRVTQVSISGTISTEQPPLKDKSMWSDQEKRVQKIDRLKKKTVVVTSDPLALIAEKTNVSRKTSSSSANEKISEVSYYLSESERKELIEKNNDLLAQTK
nr:hypothetical protein [Tanacetum cinerariifolium]